MFLRLKKIVPKDQLVVIHATLGDVEWPGTIEHIQNTIGDYEFHTCQNPNKTFLQMVEHRGMFPDKSRRQCTSDLKRGPLETLIRRTLKAKGKELLVNCMGMRAEESTDRSKLTTFKFSERNSKAGRRWYEWLPIHKMKTTEVFATIKSAGEEPHWAYKSGMTRLSCSFCIMSSVGDLKTAALLRPDLYRTYVEMEKKLNHTLQMSGKTLPELTGIN
jgi:3'-phosphoadenosine 5'-phosphosulfate sulfotransferase (PAPS reductase)/FAD synthetase